MRVLQKGHIYTDHDVDVTKEKKLKCWKRVGKNNNYCGTIAFENNSKISCK